MFSTLTPLSLRWVWGQLSCGSWVGTSWWCLVRDFGKLVHKALFQGGKALPGQGSSVCPPPYSCLKITTSLRRPSVRGDHHGRSPGDGGLGLRGPNKPGPWQNAKVRVSTDLPLAQNKTKKKPRKVPRADISCRTRVHFMFLYRQILVPPGDFGAFLSLWWI